MQNIFRFCLEWAPQLTHAQYLHWKGVVHLLVHALASPHLLAAPTGSRVTATLMGEGVAQKPSTPTDLLLAMCVWGELCGCYPHIKEPCFWVPPLLTLLAFTIANDYTRGCSTILITILKWRLYAVKAKRAKFRQFFWATAVDFFSGLRRARGVRQQPEYW